ncbi:MAG: thiamine phosphate synthase [Longimicrobiales bacterium]
MTERRTYPLDLRLIVITDARLAAPRTVVDVVAAALAAGAPAIQLRDKTCGTRELLALADALLPAVRAHDALLFVNDRTDVAMMAGADGVHLGPDDLSVAAARRIAPPNFLIGYSTDHPDAARAAVVDGADYIGCGVVFGTQTKADAADERIGTARLDEVAHAVAVPVVAIGGIDETNIETIGRTAAAGAAVVSAVMSAPDPGAAVRSLLDGLARGWQGAVRV